MTGPAQRRVGVIGLGAMGLGVAAVLVRHGFEVFGCDVRAGALEKLRQAGGIACDTPAEVGLRCDVVIILVVNASQTEQVLFGNDGALARMRRGSVVIACATTSADFVLGLGQRLTEQEVLLLDAPVTGGVKGAAEGSLTVLASGPPEAFLACEDVLEAISSRVCRFGGAHGLGSKAKMVNQLLVGVHIAAAAEAMALAVREGLDPKVLYEAIRSGAGSSWAFCDRVPRMVEGTFEPETALDIFVKDLGLVLDAARANVFPTPLAATAYQMFVSASAIGYGQQDDSAIIKLFPAVNR